jgi:hypothetical protein
LTRKLILNILPILMIVGMTGCERPSTIAPVSAGATQAPAAKAVTPTLMIKTPVKVATQASGFQEILSATQTAVATIRSGTLTATASGMFSDGLTTGTPGTPGTPGIGTPGVMSTPMALGTIYPGTAVVSGTPGVAGTPGVGGTQPVTYGTMTIPTATKFIPNFPVIPGVPTFGVLSVVGDSTVTIMTSEFPAKSKYTVYMGASGSRGLGGTLLGTFDTDAGGQKTLAFNIPATLKGFSPIDIRIEFPDGRYTFNFFYNITAN